MYRVACCRVGTRVEVTVRKKFPLVEILRFVFVLLSPSRILSFLVLLGLERYTPLPATQLLSPLLLRVHARCTLDSSSERAGRFFARCLSEGRSARASVRSSMYFRACCREQKMLLKLMHAGSCNFVSFFYF